MANVDERKTDMKDDGLKADSVAFTPPQQSRVQELIDDAYKRRSRRHRAFLQALPSWTNSEKKSRG